MDQINFFLKIYNNTGPQGLFKEGKRFSVPSIAALYSTSAASQAIK